MPGNQGAVEAPALGLRARQGWRLVLMRLALVVFSPLVFLMAAELGLRLAGFGYSPRFFVREPSHGQMVTNPKAPWQFFPRAVATLPAPQVLRHPKPRDVIRVVVLGGSAAYGTPRPAHSFGRVLQLMLNHEYPGMRFEIVNAALPSITSHGARLIMRDALVLEPDIFIVYMGNNEVIGPYGAGSVFAEHSPRLPLIRLTMGLRRLRCGQLIGQWAGAAAWGGKAEMLHGLDNRMGLFLEHQIAVDDPRLAIVYRHFEENLLTMCRTSRQTGVPLVLCTVAVNLRDWPPIASQHGVRLSFADQGAWDGHYATGMALLEQGACAAALAAFEKAAKIDDRHADLVYRMARCRFALGEGAAAGELFGRARDLDTLRFRADARINGVIRAVARAEAGRDVHLLDVERAFADGSPAGAPGQDLFHEHVHLRLAGNERLARVVLDGLRPLLGRRGHVAGGRPLISAEIAQRLAYSRWDEFDTERTIVTTSFNPHKGAAGAAIFSTADMLESLRQEAMRPAHLAEAEQWYRAAMAADPLDVLVRERFAVFLEAIERYTEAAAQWEEVVRLTPNVWHYHIRRGQTASLLGRHAEALAHLQRAVAICPDDADLRLNLVDAHWQLGRSQQAAAQLRRAERLMPPSAAGLARLGNAWAMVGHEDKAADYRRRSLARSQQSGLRAGP